MDAVPSDWLNQFIFQFVFHLVKILMAPIQRQSELHWVFLLSTVVIGWAVWRLRSREAAGQGGVGWRAFRQRYFSKAIWWHPSARVDYRYYLINGLIIPLVFGAIILNEPRVSGWLASVLGSASNPGPSDSSILLRVAFTLLFFLAYDLGRFIAHSVLHDIPWLWEFHKVHHSAEVLTPFTAYRVHPIDLAVMALFPALLTGLVSWGVHRFIDPGVTVYTYFGLHILLWISNLVGNLRHWHVWVTYGPTLNRWFISPAHHQLHHSAEPRHWGCNRGNDLALWDRLYGTLIIPSEEKESFAMGLGDGTDGQWHKVHRLYAWPFRNLVQPKAAQAPLKP